MSHCIPPVIYLNIHSTKGKPDVASGELELCHRKALLALEDLSNFKIPRVSL